MSTNTFTPEMESMIAKITAKAVAEALAEQAKAEPKAEPKPRASRAKAVKSEEKMAFVECKNTRVIVFYDPSKTYKSANGKVTMIYKTRANLVGLEEKKLEWSAKLIAQLAKTPKKDLVIFKSLGVGNRVYGS